MAKVLVVEDDPHVLLLVETQLRKAGHHVKTACSGPDALKVVSDKTPDIVVLDVTLPGMTGLDLLKAFREIESVGDVPAIFLSARTRPEDIQLGRDLGAVYITKPYVRSVLLNAIDKALSIPLDEW